MKPLVIPRPTPKSLETVINLLAKNLRTKDEILVSYIILNTLKSKEYDLKKYQKQIDKIYNKYHNYAK